MFFEFLETFGGFLVAIFVIVDPFAMVPVYLILTEHDSPQSRGATRKKASLVAFSILFLFAILGNRVFQFFGITMPAFQIAGGLLLLTTGIDQLKANRTRVQKDEEDESIKKEDIQSFLLQCLYSQVLAQSLPSSSLQDAPNTPSIFSH